MRYVPLLILLASQFVLAAETRQAARLLAVRKIWDRAPHNAFTDLVRYKDEWYCTFREGAAHVSPDGKLRIISSADGKAWESAALVSMHLRDLRDPKLCMTPHGEVMLVAAAAPPAAGGKYQTYAWFSKDLRTWSEPSKIGEEDFWLWRVAWHDGRAYSIGYGCKPGIEFVRLYASDDGRTFRPIVSKLLEPGYPSESALVFLPSDTALCLLRRDARGQSSAQLGEATPPYTQWTFHDLGMQLGGPSAIRLPDGRLVAAGRVSTPREHTGLCWLNAAPPSLEEFLPLPSGGDTSYPGLVWHDSRLWVSYYSSHEGRTAIYLAEIALPSK